MDEAAARKELAEIIQPDGRLKGSGWYVAWSPGEDNATLDGQFSADELEAIAWWMRNTERRSATPPIK